MDWAANKELQQNNTVGAMKMANYNLMKRCKQLETENNKLKQKLRRVATVVRAEEADLA